MKKVPGTIQFLDSAWHFLKIGNNSKQNEQLMLFGLGGYSRGNKL